MVINLNRVFMIEVASSSGNGSGHETLKTNMSLLQDWIYQINF